MDWITGLQRAIDYMEDHLDEELDYVEIAKQACSSSFHFQRVFGILCGYTMGEYIRSRRLTLAGQELASTDAKVIDVALKYGYDSPESFCRAFTRFHGITPSAAKLDGASLKSFTRLSVKLVLEGGTTMNYRIEKQDTFRVIAKKRRFGSTEDPHIPISAMWASCCEDGTVEKLQKYVRPEGILGPAIVGICLDNPNTSDFEYAIGAEYTGGGVEEGLTVLEIPGGTWAVFSGTGPMPDSFQKVWKQIYTEFFSSSSYEPAYGPSIEAYSSPEVFSEDFHFDIWIAVQKKK